MPFFNEKGIKTYKCNRLLGLPLPGGFLPGFPEFPHTRHGLSKKKPAANRSPQPALPLRHIGYIVIWEGNYRSDILNIGQEGQNLERS
jgi:hypothetical protein